MFVGGAHFHLRSSREIQAQRFRITPAVVDLYDAAGLRRSQFRLQALSLRDGGKPAAESKGLASLVLTPPVGILNP